MLARFAGQRQNVQHCSLLNAAETGGSAHAVAFHEAVEDHADLFPWQAHVCAERLILRFLEAFAALLALVALHTAFVEASFHGFNFATVAGHVDLDLSSGRVHNEGE